MSKTVLLVEDDRVSREIGRRGLEDHGYNVLLAENGEEALTVLETEKPDLMFLDVEMPVMNGYTFLTEWKKRCEDGNSPFPIVMLTAHDNMEPLFARHGVSGYIVKPLDFKKVLEKTIEILGE